MGAYALKATVNLEGVDGFTTGLAMTEYRKEDTRRDRSEKVAKDGISSSC